MAFTQCLSCPAAWTGDLGAVGQSELTHTHRCHLSSEQLLLSQADNGYVLLPHGHMRWMEQGVAPPLKHRTDPEDLLEEISREGCQRCLTGICLLCELEGGKKSTILWSSWTPVMFYPVVSHSGSMGSHGDLFISYLQPIQRNLFPPLLSLEGWCDP